MGSMKRHAAILMLCVTLSTAPWAAIRPVEVHQVLDLPDAGAKVAALTLDACGGGFDSDLVRFLVDRTIPATIFVTRRWIDRNPAGLALLLAHPGLFALEDHGENHVPAVIGAGRRVYGIAGNRDRAALEREIVGGAQAIARAGGTSPQWYRGATALYDSEALGVVEALGLKVAGFSVNADAGATLGRKAIVARLKGVRPGDIIIAHMRTSQPPSRPKA